MNLPSIKELVKDNNVRLDHYKSGNLFYHLSLWENTYDQPGFAKVEVSRYQFPVPISDVGEAKMSDDKAIYFMRWIKRAIEDKTFVEL